jgi:hypothetical protein
MQIEIPQSFPADWHHQLGPRLNPFPRCLSFGSPDLTYWPDLASFVDGDGTAQMLYVRSRPSSFSMTVVYDDAAGEWHVLKHQDCDVMSAIRADNYHEAMAAAISQPVVAAEMTDMFTVAE